MTIMNLFIASILIYVTLSSQSIIRVIKSSRMRWARNVALMGG
jgi:hypothetical protein